MSKMVQIRNVPDPVHRTLKARAAHAGTTLSEFILAELVLVAQRPTIDEVVARIQRHGPSPSLDSVTAVRAEREARR